MTRLLQIEFQKIWKNKASRVLTIAYFVILSFIALIASIKFKFAPMFKMNRIGAKARENEEAKE